MSSTPLRLLSIAAGVGLAHVVSGLLIFFNVAALNVTPLATLNHALPFWGGVRFTLLGVGISALVPFFIPSVSRLAVILLLTPQQILLGFHLASVVIALGKGAYPDGYVPNGGAVFILADQIWLLTVILWHSLEYSAVLSGVSR